jgi:hypothetical protein
MRLLDAAGLELSALLGRGVDGVRNFREEHRVLYQYVQFGPSGSGFGFQNFEPDELMSDFVVHGARRWLLAPHDEILRMSRLAQESVGSNAFTFFKTKLKELTSTHLGLSGYVEANQKSGDLIIVPPGWNYIRLAIYDSISLSEIILGTSEKDRFAASVDKKVWKEDDRVLHLCFCYDAEDMHLLPNISEQTLQMLQQNIHKVQNPIPGILNLLLECGSTLALDRAFPELGVQNLTVCTPTIWKQCREQLRKKAAEKQLAVSLAWLPLDAPTSHTHEWVETSVQREEL